MKTKRAAKSAASWMSSVAVPARPTWRTIGGHARMPAPGPSPDRRPEGEQRGCGMSPREGTA
eukprot:6772134-Heterocapsa_arctica.AAC.1